MYRLPPGMQFASRVGSGSSILSPLARPYHADGSVAAYLQNQARSPTSAVTPSTSEYRQQDMQRLESMLKELEDTPIDEDEDDNATVQLTQSQPAVQLLLPAFEPLTTLPVRTGPITPPTPAESAKPQLLEEPVVRVTMHVWDAMGRDLEALRDEKRALEIKIARLEKQDTSPSQAVDIEKDRMETQIGKLRYQNEQNKTQKATMARTLSQKDVEIKQLQLDLDTARESLEAATGAAQAYTDVVKERDYLQAQLREDRIGSSRLLSDLTDVKDCEIQALTKELENLQEVVKRSNDAQANADDEYKRLAHTRLEAFNKCEKQLKSMNAKYAAEHDRVNQLEDYIEDLRGKLSQVGDLQAELRQKSSDCDRYRTMAKNQEKMVETCKQQIERARNDNQALRGAAHLVKPAPTSKLSPLVLGCTECYTKNITCDNKARCRYCTENNEQCSRWRCSLKHVLGQCPRVPCTFPHEEDGWLLATEPRPQW